MSATIHTTLGNLKVELACGQAPRLCENWLQLAASGAYDGTKLHRNIAGFLIQGGDPTGTGKGGEAAVGGKLADEFHADLKHDARGVLAMASNGAGTIGSQFYFTYAAQATLDGVYCVIGKLIGGGEVLDAMERAPVGAKHRPSKDIVIGAVTIHANPFATGDV
jgi:peptidyl-prolyl cis-trans isomerase-like 3